MRGLPGAIAVFGLMIVAYLAGYLNRPNAITDTWSDTTHETVLDTIAVYKPVARDSSVVRYTYVPVTVRRDVITEVDSVVYDTLGIELPVEQKHYADTLYDAWVSGYEASLDSIKVYPRREVYRITERVTVQKDSRFGIGVSAGAAVTPKGAQPYIGIGVVYRLW